jgi:septal ring factor EnvC (AmiA/AmiB activator)
MAASQRDLDIIDQHIAEAEARIGRQRELVDELCRDHPGGVVAEEAKQLLSKMLDALKEMKEHRRLIVENLQRSGKAR